MVLGTGQGGRIGLDSSHHPAKITSLSMFRLLSLCPIPLRCISRCGASRFASHRMLRLVNCTGADSQVLCVLIYKILDILASVLYSGKHVLSKLEVVCTGRLCMALTNSPSR